MEATTSWCYVGAGLRLSMEMLGPEYSLSVNSLDAGPKIFFSREVTGDSGEDLVEMGFPRGTYLEPALDFNSR